MSQPRVAVVTTSGCKYCKRAKEALKANSIDYQEVEVQGDVELLTKFREASGIRTVPQIFVEGKCIGGSDDLIAALSDGSFPTLVEAASGPPLTPDLQAAVQQALQRRQQQQQEAMAAAEADSAAASQQQALEALAVAMADPASGVPRTSVGRRSLPFGSKSAQPPSFTAQDAAAWLQANPHPAPLATTDPYPLLAKLQAANLLSDTSQQPGGPDAPAIGPGNPTTRLSLRGDAPAPAYGSPLNGHYPWFGPARPAATVAAELRALILELYDKYLSPDGKAVSYRRMGQDPLWRRFVDATAELQKVDLAPLGTEELTALFINLYNVLIIHATVAHGPPASALDRSRFFGSAAKYWVAGQQYSADDMEHGVLRGNQPAPSSFLKKHQFSASDPRSTKVVSPMDPRIHFALVCGAKSCPPIRIYTPESLQEGLQGAAEAFCTSEVTPDPSSGTVTLSKIFQWYGKDFGKSDTEVLQAIAGFLQGEQKKQLEALLAGGQRVKVVYAPYDWSLNSDE